MRTQEGLVAEVDGVVLGFLIFEHRFDDAANGFTLARDFEGYWSGGDTPVLMIRVLD